MTHQHNSPDLAEIVADAQRKRRRGEFERGEQLRARLAVLQETREMRLVTQRAELLRLEQATRESPWDLRAGASYEAAKVRHSSELIPLDTEVAQVIKELNTPTKGFAGNSEQFKLVEGADLGPAGSAGLRSDRTWYPSESHPVGTPMNPKQGGY